ncbi:hypothetical protein ACQKJG_18015 [Priestia megaterium]|uniref:hypothetical protein n=1 Tax=Priestia megaterium TaxID=1404 RepID=UPI003CFCA5D4
MKKDLFVMIMVQHGMIGDTMIKEDIVEIFTEALDWHKKNNSGLVIIEKGIEGATAVNERLFSFDVKEDMGMLQERIYECVANYGFKKSKVANA